MKDITTAQATSWIRTSQLVIGRLSRRREIRMTRHYGPKNGDNEDDEGFSWTMIGRGMVTTRLTNGVLEYKKGASDMLDLFSVPTKRPGGKRERRSNRRSTQYL
jgi:hypothetical protein